MIAAVDQDIDILPHGDFCSVAAAEGGPKEVTFRDEAGTTELCGLADECFTWARSADLRSVNPNLYYRCWRLLAKARMLAQQYRLHHIGAPVKITVAIAREGDHLVACITLEAALG